MDAEKGRDRRRFSSSRRGQRWSMCSQKLEQIVKAIMKPVMDHGHCFDRDDAGLLEEYLTEAGLRMLEQGGAVPNFAEIGMLLQSYACNYSRKVDHLVHLAQRFRSELSGLECQESPVPDPEAEPSPRRRRAVGGGGGGGGEEFSPIVLAPAPLSVRRAGPPAGPPPALPRQYSELSAREPRPDRALHADFGGEPIGSLDDFYVSRRTRRGFLVDELEADEEQEAEAEEELARPLSLLQLQAAIERSAAGEPHPAPPATPPPASPVSAPSTPPPDLAPLYTSTPLPTPLPVRKRKLTIASEESQGVVTLVKDVEMWRKMPAREFALPELWVKRVVRVRREALLSMRRSLSLSPSAPDFRGFNTSWTDIGGFRGWARSEGNAARAAVRRLSAALLADSDDDGFFERSSDSLSPSLADPPPPAAVCGCGSSETARWQEEVVRRAARAAPLELGALARDVRRALPAHPAPPLPWRALLAGVRRAQPQPSRVLLDVLTKATRGELDLVPGAPGRVGDFSLRLRERPPPAPEEDSPPPPDP